MNVIQCEATHRIISLSEHGKQMHEQQKSLKDAQGFARKPSRLRFKPRTTHIAITINR